MQSRCGSWDPENGNRTRNAPKRPTVYTTYVRDFVDMAPVVGLIIPVSALRYSSRSFSLYVVSSNLGLSLSFDWAFRNFLLPIALLELRF